MESGDTVTSSPTQYISVTSGSETEPSVSPVKMQSGELPRKQGMADSLPSKEALGGPSFAQKPGEKATNEMQLQLQEISPKLDGEVEKKAKEQIIIEERAPHDLQIRNTSQNDESDVVCEDQSYDQLCHDHNKLKTEYDHCRATLIIREKNLEQEKRLFEKAKADHHAQYESLRQQTKGLQQKMNSQITKTVHLEQENRRLKEALEAFKTKLAKVEAERDAAKTTQKERDDIKGELITIKAERDVAQRELATVKGERNEAKGELTMIRAERDTGKGEIVTLKAERDAAKSKVTAVKGEHGAARAEVAALRKERDVAKDEITKIQRERDIDKGELIKSNAELDVTRRELASVTVERDGAKGELVAVKGELVAVKAERDTAKIELATMRAEHVALRRQCENLRDSNDRLQQWVAGLSNRELNAVILREELQEIISGLRVHCLPSTANDDNEVHLPD